MNVADKMDALLDGTWADLGKSRNGWVVHWHLHHIHAAHPFNWNMAVVSMGMINRHAVDCPDHGGQLQG